MRRRVFVLMIACVGFVPPDRAEDPTEEGRRHAQEIGKEIKNEDYQRKLVPYFADAMRQDKSPALRAQAATTLGRMGALAKTVVNVMIESLQDPEPTVRAAAAEGL